MNIEELVDGILLGDKAALSRTITLLESARPEHREIARSVIDQCPSKSDQTIRIGITGTPGVGKSTFIESIGKLLLKDQHRLAILAIDPSSKKTKGSILGDKTRMESLAGRSDVFIRPSPAGRALGGVGLHTRETILLCEAAGFDRILIETVGVGQSETAVHSITDMLLLLLLPGSGDELQGIKKGIVEMADSIVINKTDENTAQKVTHAISEYKKALQLMAHDDTQWRPKIMSCSALHDEGTREILEMTSAFIKHQKENGFFDQKRRDQNKYWLHENIHELLLDSFYQHPEIKEKIKMLETAVVNGEVSAHRSALDLINMWRKRSI